ncbi:sucrose-phosphate synthase [Acrasis kona]|uniref:Sucrose-phosphate synthase n=1 Tax=Acrasis kona TaxID=1008807 RepID=A0AAW2ZJX4_9EUKA
MADVRTTAVLFVLMAGMYGVRLASNIHQESEKQIKEGEEKEKIAQEVLQKIEAEKLRLEAHHKEISKLQQEFDQQDVYYKEKEEENTSENTILYWAKSLIPNWFRVEQKKE